MSKKAELLELAEMIEAGGVGHDLIYQINSALFKKTGPEKPIPITGRLDCAIDKAVIFGSLDAAKALHDAVLPGCDMKLSSVRAGTIWRVCIWPNLAEVRKLDFWGEATNPAAAWVAAILRATIT